MTHVRVHDEHFDLTQEFLGQMLGVRGQTVAIAIGIFSNAQLIHYIRSRITIMDRAGLESASCECYRAIRTQFDKLIGADG
jgi:hypothetical protein